MGKSVAPTAIVDPALLGELTPRERAFVEHPLVTTNPCQAAREVGYSKTTSEHAATMARRLLYYIQHYNRQRMAAAGVTQQRIIEELAAIAFADETDYFEAIDTPDGQTIKSVRDITRLPREMRAAVKELSTGFYNEAGAYVPAFSFKLHNKVEALKALAEYFGMKQGKAGGTGAETDPIQRRMLEQFTDEELEQVNAIFETAAHRTKAAVSKRRDAKAIPSE